MAGAEDVGDGFAEKPNPPENSNLAKVGAAVDLTRCIHWHQMRDTSFTAPVCHNEVRSVASVPVGWGKPS